MNLCSSSPQPPFPKKKRERHETWQTRKIGSHGRIIQDKIRQTNRQRQTISTQIKVSFQNNAMQFVTVGERPPRAYRRRSFVCLFFFFSFLDFSLSYYLNPMEGFEVESRCCALNGQHDRHSFPLGPFDNSVPL